MARARSPSVLLLLPFVVRRSPSLEERVRERRRCGRRRCRLTRVRPSELVPPEPERIPRAIFVGRWTGHILSELGFRVVDYGRYRVVFLSRRARQVLSRVGRDRRYRLYARRVFTRRKKSVRRLLASYRARRAHLLYEALRILLGPGLVSVIRREVRDYLRWLSGLSGRRYTKSGFRLGRKTPVGVFFSRCLRTNRSVCYCIELVEAYYGFERWEWARRQFRGWC